MPGGLAALATQNFGATSGASATATGVTLRSAGDGVYLNGTGLSGFDDSILDGADRDIYAANGTASLRFDDYDKAVVGSGGLAPSGTVSAPPVYVNAGAGDLRQAASSPTIDAGDDDLVVGSADLDGNLRIIGSHVDIGAYEHVTAGPVAGAGSATDIAATTATVVGAVDTKGNGTTYHLEYGTTTAYGQRTPDAFVFGSAAPSTPKVPLTSLAPVTTYHFRRVGSGEGGTTVGPDATFTTAVAPPTVTAGAARDVTGTTATLDATADITQAPSGAVRFTYGDASTPEQTTTGGLGSAQLTGLTPGTTYTWAAHITTTGGTADSATGTFTTTPTPSPLPCAFPTPGTAATGPSLTIGKRAARSVGVAVRARCGDVACRVRAGVVVIAGRKRLGALTASRRTVSLRAGATRRFRSSASRRLRKRVRRVLRRHPKTIVRLRVRAVFTATDGTRVVKRVTARVR